MFRIRARTFAAFEQAAADTFLHEMVGHCRQLAPGLCRALTEEELLLAVRHGVQRAQSHGFDQRGPARLYLDLMIALGSGFDTDWQYPWAAEVLVGEDYHSPMDRAEGLFACASAHFAEVDGPANVHARGALAALATRLRHGAELDRARPEDDAMRLLAEIHPQKVAACGDAQLRRVVAEAMRAEPTPASAFPRIALAFALGHRFDADPFLPWIGRALSPSTPPSGERTAEWLEDALTWFEPVRGGEAA